MKKLLKNSLILSGLVILTGCASKPFHEQVAGNAVDFNEYQLAQNEGYSDSLERMYLLSQAKPIKENNLDTFYIGKEHHGASNAALATDAVATIAGSLNVFQLATSSILNMANRTSLDYKYQNNLLVVVEPVVGGNVQEALHHAKQRNLMIIKEAYKNAGINTKVYSDKDVAYINTYDTTFVVPFDSEKTVPNCSTPNGYKSIEETGNLKESNIGCFAMVYGVGNMYLNNTEDTKFPLGDFVEVHSTLPAVFPLENLTSDSEYDWVYQPSFTFFRGKWIQNFVGFTEETFTEEYKKGRFNVNPKITLLKSGDTLYFNKNAKN